jgi:small-conductance mechanosensitive channel
MTFVRTLRAVVAAAALAAAGVVAAQGGAGQGSVPTAEVAEFEVAPVELDGRPLFRVAGLASTIPAGQRAERIAARIAEVADDPASDPAKLAIRQDAGARTIVLGNTAIVTITAPDAALMAGLDVDTVALTVKDRIAQAIADYRAERTPAALRASALRVLVAVAAAVALIALCLWLLARTGRAIDRRFHHRIHTVGIQSFEIVRAERIRGAIEAALTFVRYAVVAVVGFVLLDYALLQFPWTRGAALGMLGAVLAPLRALGVGVLAHIPNVLFLVVLVLIVRLLLKVVRLFFDAVARGKVKLHDFDPEWAEPTYKLLRLAIVAFSLVVAYPYIPGSNSDAFKGVSIFVGIVFSLASTTAIANMIAGYALIYRRAFKVGDRIEVGGTVGVVTRSRLQVTHLRTRRNEEVIVPNSTLLNGKIVNYNTYAAAQGLVISVTAGIGYETPWRQVEGILLEAAGKTEGVLKEPAPYVWHLSLGDFCVTYELNVFIADALAAGPVRTALTRNVLDGFNTYGVQIMTPAYEGDPAQPKIVKREDWHLAPAPPDRPASPPPGDA